MILAIFQSAGEAKEKLSPKYGEASCIIRNEMFSCFQINETSTRLYQCLAVANLTGFKRNRKKIILLIRWKPDPILRVCYFRMLISSSSWDLQETPQMDICVSQVNFGWRPQHSTKEISTWNRVETGFLFAIHTLHDNSWPLITPRVTFPYCVDLAPRMAACIQETTKTASWTNDDIQWKNLWIL